MRAPGRYLTTTARILPVALAGATLPRSLRWLASRPMVALVRRTASLTGEEAGRFYTIPGPGEPGHDTWEGDDWEHGGAPVWITGSYDPELNLTYWGVGNPGPDWNPDQRPGDNLYSDSVIALDADTGELKWHFQFTPNDGYDYDSVQVPVLADVPIGGQKLKGVMVATPNGLFYGFGRAAGQRPPIELVRERLRAEPAQNRMRCQPSRFHELHHPESPRVVEDDDVVGHLDAVQGDGRAVLDAQRQAPRRVVAAGGLDAERHVPLSQVEGVDAAR